MVIHKDSLLVWRLGMAETGRRGGWREAEKPRIVEEGFSGHRQVSATARRHGMSRTLLAMWRRACREGRLGGGAAMALAPVVVGRRPTAVTEPSLPCGRGGRIEIVLTNGRRIIVEADVDAAALARVIAATERA